VSTPLIRAGAPTGGHRVDGAVLVAGMIVPLMLLAGRWIRGQRP